MRFHEFPKYLTIMQVARHCPPMVMVWPASLSVCPSPLPTTTLAPHMLSPAFRLTGESGFSQNNQPILGHPSRPVTLSPSRQHSHQAHCHRPQHVRYTPIWMHNHPHTAPLSHWSRTGGHLALQNKGWYGGMAPPAPSGHCTPAGPGLPHLPPSPL